MSPPTVLVLGASFVGIAAAHRLLRLLPAEYRVVLVSPSDHLYWNMAVPRALVKNNQFLGGADNSAALFYPILPGFAAHAANRFEFVLGTATALDPAANTAAITTAAGPRSISYTHVIIATGGRAHDDWPFKALASRAATEAALSSANARIAAAERIVLSGAGPAGVETAGEIATLWKGAGKSVVLLDSADGPLPMLPPHVRAEARRQLQRLGVEVRSNTRVVKSSPTDSGGVQLELSSGDTLTADLHIPTRGLVPNTSFVPAALLDASGFVRVSGRMRSLEVENVWSAGDAAAVHVKTLMTVGPMIDALVASLVAAVLAGQPERVKEHANPESTATMLVPVGGGFAAGTGILFGWRPWGVLIWLLKGRSFFISNASKVALGQALATGGKP